MDRLTVDMRSPIPSYKQLADQLRERIASGEIGPDEPLPSLTQMAQETGLSMSTVKRVMKMLAGEGLIVTVPGRATFVAPKE